MFRSTSFVAFSPAFRQLACQRFLQTSSVLNMAIKPGTKLPSVNLFEGAPDKKVNTSEYAKGTVVFFGVPGAFTPTCNNDHAPGFVKLAPKFKNKGVSIVCVAVNDPFVMSAWAKSVDPQGSIRFLADTTGAFAQALDVALDVTQVLGNVRSKRYSMLVNDGLVKAINVEPDGIGHTCSSAVEMLKLV